MSVGRLPERMPARHPEVLVAEFETELVVLVPDARRAHHLDDGLSLVLDSCDGVTPTASVVEEVAATGEPQDAVERWLLGSVRTLHELGVLADSDWMGFFDG